MGENSFAVYMYQLMKKQKIHMNALTYGAYAKTISVMGQEPVEHPRVIARRSWNKIQSQIMSGELKEVRAAAPTTTL